MSSSRVQPPRTLPGRIFRVITGLMVAVLAALVLSVLIEWVGLTFFWADRGASRSAEVLQQDIAWLRGPETASGGSFLPPPAVIAGTLADRMRIGVIRSTGLEGLVRFVSRTSVLIGTYAEAGLNALQIFLVRLAITITALPLFVLFVWWGCCEGFVLRDLRRFGADFEHATIYHWSVHVAGATGTVPVFLYLTWPGSIHPAWVFVPGALALGINVLLIVSMYIKHV